MSTTTLTAAAFVNQPPLSDARSVASFSLQGKTALVTGASRGIGRACAVMLAAAGADVALGSSAAGLEACEGVRRGIENVGRQARTYPFDLRVRADVEAMFGRVRKDLEAVDILVNNAGVARDRSFRKMDRDTWDEVLDVTLNSVFDITHAFIDSMAERRWGRVINISSFVARIGNFGQANYAADIDEHVWDAHAACQVSWRRDCAARMADVERGAPVWSAPPDARESSAMGRYLRWLEHTQGERFDGYEGLHAWSIGDLPRFWASLVE